MATDRQNTIFKIKSILIAFGLSLIAAVFPPESAIAKDSGSVESILDRLESRLTNFENESLGLQLSAEPFSDIEDKEPITASYSSKSKIRGKVKEADNITEIATAIAKLESEIEKLSADVQRTRQKVLEDAQINNFVEITALLNDTDLAGIKSFSTKIDGYEVYGLHEDSSFWLPNHNLPVYSGPLQPGNHRIDVESRIVMKTKQPMPLESDVYRFVNKSFDINVPANNFRKRWVLEIKPPTTPEGQAELTVNASDL
jgi:hypothetical protein